MSQSLGHAWCASHSRVLPDNPKRSFDAQDLLRLQICSDNLPFANASLDGVVLHHVLESALMHGRIREVERVLKPGGGW